MKGARIIVGPMWLYTERISSSFKKRLSVYNIIMLLLKANCENSLHGIKIGNQFRLDLLQDRKLGSLYIT